MKRTILITGASGKFGRALVAYFLSIGDRVIATCRSFTSENDLRAAIRSNSNNLVVVKVDLTGTDAVNLLLAELDKQGIQPDCVVHSARDTAYLKIEEDGVVKRENFANEFLLDVIIPYELTMALVMQKNSQLRRVVNIGSMYGIVAANPNLYTDPLRQSPLHYSVAKAALSHLTKELAVRLAPNNVQVNCIAFGGVEGRVDEGFKQRYAQLCPMGRMLQEHEVLGPVDILLSDKCSGVTGHTMAVDGGWSAW
jgi:NAD(P)-dependent dehydrogenase (short-subunit alcohol dehydrogenase family)